VTARTLTVPDGIKVKARFTSITTATSGSNNWLADPDEGSTAAGPTASNQYNEANVFSSGQHEIYTNTSRQINTDANGTGATITIITRGWTDNRRV
jgi:hypothetical protein